MAHLAIARRTSPQRPVGPRLTAAPASPHARGRERWISAAIALAALLLWETLARAGLISAMFFPPPTAIARALTASLVGGAMLDNLAATLLRVLPGVLLGGVPGLLLGLAMGWSRSLRIAADPFIAALHPLPKLALLPLFMVIFGIGEGSKIAAIAASAFFPILISAMAGVRQISPIHFEVAHNYGARPLQVLTRVVLPGSLPMILTGLRLAANVALLVTIAVEIAAAQVGLGAMVWLSWQVLRVELLYATLFVIAFLGIALNGVLLWITRRFVPWLPEREAHG